jgi:hypothetical protein
VKSAGSSSDYFLWSSPLIYRNSIYLGTASGCDSSLIQGQLLKVNASNLAAPITSFFSVVRGNNASDLGGTIWSTPSLDPSTGTIWTTTGNEQFAWQNPAVGDFPRSFLALNASNVSVRLGNYTATVPGNDHDFGAGPTFFKNQTGVSIVAAVNKVGYAYALTASNVSTNGWAPIWKQRVSNVTVGVAAAIAPAAYGGGLLFFAGANQNISGVGNCQGTIKAINTGNWTKPSGKSWTWQHCAPGPIDGGLTYANGLVIYAALTNGTQASELNVLYASNGTIAAGPFYFSHNQSIAGEPIVVDGRIFVGTGNFTALTYGSTGTPQGPGYVYAFGIPLAVASSSALRGVPSYLFGPNAVAGFGNVTGGMPIYNFTWSWGDGAYSFGPNPGHSYSSGGTFTAYLEVADAAGDLASKGWKVTNTPHYCGPSPPVSLIVCYTLSVVPCKLSSCSAPSLSTSLAAGINIGSSNIIWDWSFGDGSAHSSSAAPIHVYATDNTYTVIVIVTNTVEHWQGQRQFQVTV